MKKLGFYGLIVAALAFTLWFCTKDGMEPSEGAAPPDESVGTVMLESMSMGRRVCVEDGEDIERLSAVLSTLSQENGMVVDLEVDFPDYMRDWSLEWLSPQGESLALVEISSVGTVFRGDQCFNFLGGEIFDMDYLRGLLLGLPEVREPQEILEVDAVTGAFLYSKGREAVIFGKDELEELKGMLRTASFYEGGEQEADSEYSIGLRGADYRDIGTVFLYGNRVGCGEYVFTIEGSGFDEDWLERMYRPQIKYDEDILYFSLYTDDGNSYVRITDPGLAGQLEAALTEIEFHDDGPARGEAEPFCINRYFADDNFPYGIFVIDQETIRYGGRMYKAVGDKKLDLELYAQLADPEGPYKNHPGVEYWKEGDAPMPAVTPRPSPSPSGEPEPTPAGTARPYTMDAPPPEEKVFDISGGHILMMASDGNTVAIKGAELEALAEELSGLRFRLREECTLDAYCMHARQEDKERYHGNPLFTLTWYDSDGYKREEFTARGMEGWIDYNGWYYQAEKGGIDMENLKRLDKEMPSPDWYERRPMDTVREDISAAKSLWITDESETWAAVITDPELLERISGNIQGLEFFADTQGSGDGDCTYELEWYRGALGPMGGGGSIEWLRIKDKYRVLSGSNYYKLREGEIDMELLDELCKPDGEYSDREGVRFVRKEDLVPEDKSD